MRVHAPLGPPEPVPVPFSDADDAERLRRHERKRAHDAGRQLDGWERYRALIDASDEAYELIDISNREARFALILMGALNAVALVLITRADALSLLPASDRYWKEDSVDPPFRLNDDGTLDVPDGPGIGVEVRRDVLAGVTRQEESYVR